MFSANFKRKLNIKVLWIRNVCAFRELKIESIHAESTFRSGQLVTIFTWRLKGCHAIQINDGSPQPGNSHGIIVLQSEYKQHIQVTFFGIGNTIVKEFLVAQSNQYLMDQFAAQTKTPGISAETLHSLSTDKTEFSQVRFNHTIHIKPIFPSVALRTYKIDSINIKINDYESSILFDTQAILDHASVLAGGRR